MTHPLVSTWRLVSHVQVTVETGESFHPRGESPQGLLTYTDDGRFSIINVPGEQIRPASIKATDAEAAALYNGLTAYAGRYSLSGDTVIHHVEVSWNPVWANTDQERRFSVEGDTLTLIAGPGVNPRDGRTAISTLVWHRVR